MRYFHLATLCVISGNCRLHLTRLDLYRDRPWEPPLPRQRAKDETVVISSEPSWRSKGYAVSPHQTALPPPRPLAH